MSSVAKARQARVNSLGQASLNNFSALQAVGVVPGGLAPALG